MNIYIIFITMATLTLLLLIADIFLFFKIKTLKKKRQHCNNLIELDEAIIPFIIRAEGFKNFSSEEKKKYVLTLARQYAQNRNIKVDYTTISDRIDYFVEFCKSVNLFTGKKCDCDCHK